ncbi:MAG: hypothetical protein WA820_20225 [Bradyrhizobium sp.]
MAPDAYRAHTEAMLFDLVAWTNEGLLPSWRDSKNKGRSDDGRSDLLEWSAEVGDVLARVAPFVTLDAARNSLLAPFLVEGEEALSVISFADQARMSARIRCRWHSGECDPAVGRLCDACPE